MSELIDRKAFIEKERKLYCEDCDRRKGMKNGEKTFVYEIGEVPCRSCWVDDVLDDLEDAPTVREWHRVEEEGLPKETRCYIVYLRQGTEVEMPEWMGGEPLSYVTEMGFEKGQMLWRDGDDAYNASLSLVDTAHEFHVTHWMEKPKPPEENDDSCR